MTRKLNQGIMRLAKSLQTLTRKAVTIYEQEMEEIVGSNCRKKRRIECALDGMLGFCCDKNMLELYRKLCSHYYDIDRNAATEYVHAYRDMWDPEEEKKWK